MADAKEEERDRSELPSLQVQQEAGDLHVLDDQGNKILYKTLYANTADSGKRHLIVFIRHFYCGECESYVRALTKDLPPSTLASANTDLKIIGCGQPQVIAEYFKRTSCPFPIYCDPDRVLYKQLGMTSSLSLGEKKPDYGSSNLITSTASSFFNIVSNGRKGLQGGDFAQNGGEWLYEDGKVMWCRRMKHTRDHAEVKELKTVLGISA